MKRKKKKNDSKSPFTVSFIVNNFIYSLLHFIDHLKYLCEFSYINIHQYSSIIERHQENNGVSLNAIGECVE